MPLPLPRQPLNASPPPPPQSWVLLKPLSCSCPLRARSTIPSSDGPAGLIPPPSHLSFRQSSPTCHPPPQGAHPFLPHSHLKTPGVSFAFSPSYTHHHLQIPAAPGSCHVDHLHCCHLVQPKSICVHLSGVQDLQWSASSSGTPGLSAQSRASLMWLFPHRPPGSLLAQGLRTCCGTFAQTHTSLESLLNIPDVRVSLLPTPPRGHSSTPRRGHRVPWLSGACGRGGVRGFVM